MSDAPAAPSRDEIDARWLALIDGSITREEVHDWTVPWVEGDCTDLPSADAMIEGTLQTLHGFSMAFNPATPHLIHHGAPGTYVRSMDDIQAGYRRWKQACSEFDADPTAYQAQRRKVSEDRLAAERRPRAVPEPEANLAD